MAPVLQKQSWSEINRTKKEKRRKWKEKKLMKTIEKQKVKQVENEAIDHTVNIGGSVLKENKDSPAISTVSIAVPGSILENAQSAELRTYLAGQIARAACIFQIDEVVVFDDYGDEANAKKSRLEDNADVKTIRECCAQLGRILQYLECPQYLRKHIFPLHKDLKFAGILNPLDAPHHLRQSDDFMFREGVVTNKPVKPGQGSQVNVGLLQMVHIDKLLTPGIRCTVQLLPRTDNEKKLKGIVIPPSLPRNKIGVYWGYTVRLANSLSQVLSQCPYKNGYDLTIGTSDKGTSIDNFQCPKFQHLLIMFGGLQGLEAALENDNVLNVDDPSLLFDHYLNTLPNQGSRTIRTEEAILVSLAALRPKLNPEQNPPDFKESLVSKTSDVNINGSPTDMDRFD